MGRRLEVLLGPQNDSDSVAAIHAALDAGMNWIDTAPVSTGSATPRRWLAAPSRISP